MVKYIIYHKNGKEKIIKAKNLDDAELKANKIWKEWIDIRILKYVENFKLITSNKRDKNGLGTT